MLRRIFYAGLFIAAASMHAAKGQGIHFSQYYNAPLQVNPANAALMSDNDYRLGANYRTQWARVPVPYTTYSVFADFQAMKAQNTTNWLGIGVAFYNDKAGDGDLQLTKGDFMLAYHVQTNEQFMVSAGLSAGYAARSINYGKLYFGNQWEGSAFGFNTNLPNYEGDENNINNVGIIKTNFFDIGAGVNFSWFPNELAFMKVGIGFSHINQPKETFYNGTNVLAIRPSFNADGTFIIDRIFTLNPSIYYSAQRGASQIIAGTLVSAKLVSEDRRFFSLVAGVHYRHKGSVIGSLGLQYNDLRFMGSFDYALSSLGPEVKNYGAMEFGIVYMGGYGERSRASKSMNCPRFY